MDIFKTFVSLTTSLGALNIQKLRVGENAKRTSWDTVQEFLTTLSDQVEDWVCSDVQASPTYSIMVDEVSDVASRKHLATLCKYIAPDISMKTAILNDVELADGTATTITKKIVNQIENSGLELKKLSALGTDSATTFAGKNSGVGKQLAKMNESLIFYHCKDHGLALACKESFKDIKILRKTNEMLNNLHKHLQIQHCTKCILEECTECLH